jgi:hypothetical protein
VERTPTDVRRIDRTASYGAALARLWRWFALMCVVEPTPTDLGVVRRDDLQEFQLVHGDDVVSVVGFEQRGGSVVVLHTATPEPLRHRVLRQHPGRARTGRARARRRPRRGPVPVRAVVAEHDCAARLSSVGLDGRGPG